jgi:hypothetical protein
VLQLNGSKTSFCTTDDGLQGSCSYYLTTAVVCRRRAGQQLCDDVWMRADISLAGKHADLKFTVKYNGSDDNPVRIQELPAVFLSRKLGQLVFYDGPEPWQVDTCAGFASRKTVIITFNNITTIIITIVSSSSSSSSSFFMLSISP